MYDPGPSDEELAAIGIRREDVEDTSVLEVWPEHWDPYRIFEEIRSQWLVGANGPTGLNYIVAFKYMELMKIKKSRHLETIRAIRVMEREALRQMHKE